jgi:hypothetical protein|tara:strand:- start:1837 stop:2160 length:324 start_codon:yes stop_codon:yes gene_type:complete
MRHTVTVFRFFLFPLQNENANTSADRFDAAYGERGSFVESVSRDATGASPPPATNASPYTDPELPSTNALTPNSLATCRSAAVDVTFAVTAPAASVNDAAIPERAPR